MNETAGARQAGGLSGPKAGQAGKANGAYRVNAVERAVDVLQAFSVKEHELSLGQVSAATGLHKATAFRLLSTLCRRGLVNKDPLTGSYRLGFGLVPLAEIAKVQTGLVAQALPVMRQVRDALNETTFLSIRLGDHRIDVEQLVGLREVRRVLTLGQQKPLYVGAGSKVLLAAMSDDDIEDYLRRTELVAFSEHTIVDPDDLRADIARIRRRGYAESWNERDSDGAGASAPIYGPMDMVLGSLTVSVPTGRYTQEIRDRTVAIVLDGTRTISRSLGASTRGDGMGREERNGQ